MGLVGIWNLVKAKFVIKVMDRQSVEKILSQMMILMM